MGLILNDTIELLLHILDVVMVLWICKRMPFF